MDTFGNLNPNETNLFSRLHGSYEALKYGSVLDGLADLTGGVAESILLKGDPTGSGRLLLDLLDMTSVVTANIQVEKVKGEDKAKSANMGHPDTKLANGITMGTNYRVYGIHKVATLAGEIVQLVHLRCGDATSYVGAWAPGSGEWDEVDDEERERIGARDRPLPGMVGEFWMPYMDFIKTFTHLEVVHLDSETARDEPSMASRRVWSMRYYSGAWQRGVTAGGCRNNSGEPRHALMATHQTRKQRCYVDSRRKTDSSKINPTEKHALISA